MRDMRGSKIHFKACIQTYFIKSIQLGSTTLQDANGAPVVSIVSFVRNRKYLFLLLISFSLIVLALGNQQQVNAAEVRRGYGEPAQSKLFQNKQTNTLIQPLIDATPPHGELVLQAESYDGPLHIDKPMTISGLGGESEIIISTEEQVVIVQSDGVKLNNLLIVDERKQPQAAVISAEGHKNVVLEGLRIQTRATAIDWVNMKQSKLLGNEVSWNGESYAKRTDRGNGIYVYNSNDIDIELNTITAMYDGIYVENSTGLTLRSNKVSASRYGYHMMYAQQVDVSNNESMDNVTGLMVMTSSDVMLQYNKLTGHQANANAAAILIYDVVNAQVNSNQMLYNRIGITVERSEEIVVANNELRHNFVALQMQRADGLVLEHNQFIGNVTNVWDDGSTEPNIRNNYWDSLQGLDLDGDGYSELSYKSAPFFLALIERRPSFQLLFGTPGIAFIEQLYGGDSQDWIRDDAPSLNPKVIATSDSISFAHEIGVGKVNIQWHMLLAWLLLSVVGVYMIVNVRRYEQ
jgi:nitrous oxidase accessory protein